MNRAMNADAAASEPFSFLVGPQSREFKIHSAIVASLSEYLHRLVDGQFLEGATRKVSWPHVEEGTFVCFWQYAYTSNYDLRSIDIPLANSFDESIKEADVEGIASNSTKPQAASTVGFAWDTDGDQFAVEEAVAEDYWETKKILSKPTKRERLWSRFISFQRESSSPHTNQVGQAADVDGQQKRRLLYHAKVYILAECYGVTPLMVLSYNKLHRSLTGMQHAYDLSDFVALAQFCYESLVPNDLKELVVVFAAYKIERLWLEEQFQDLLEVHGELSKSIIGTLLNRSEPC